MWVTGEPGKPPMRAGIAVRRFLAPASIAATGILIALRRARDVSGEGQWVQTSLLQAQIALMDFQAARYLVEGEVPPQVGNDHPTSTPMGVVATADGFINIGVGGDGQWRAFCEAIGRPSCQPSRVRQGREPHPQPAADQGACWTDPRDAHVRGLAPRSKPRACRRGRSTASTRCSPTRRCAISASRRP